MKPLPPPMTVKQLREALSSYPDDAEIETEGCDCFGDVGHVQQHTGKVLLCRTDGMFEPPEAP